MLLIKNIKQLLSLDEAQSPKLGSINDAALVVDNERIAWCGKEHDLPQFHISKIIDARNSLVLPGLIDCHTHMIFAGTRPNEFAERMNGESYEAIMAKGGGIMNTVNATRAASDEELYALAHDRANKILANGTTTIEVKSGYGLNAGDELRILRLIKRLNEHHPLDLEPTFLGAHAVPIEFKNEPQRYVDKVVFPLLEQIACEKLALDCDVFCEQGAFSVNDAFAILHRAHELGMGLRAHVQQLGYSGGVSLLETLPIKSISHADYLSPEDFSIIKASGAVVEALPFASLFVPSPKHTPVKELIKNHIPVALATNFNPGSAMCHDLILAARLGVTYLGFSIEDAILAITRTAAQSLGREDIGSLKMGNKADVLITNSSSLNDFFYDWSKPCVHMVIKNGQVVNEA